MLTGIAMGAIAWSTFTITTTLFLRGDQKPDYPYMIFMLPVYVLLMGSLGFLFNVH